MSATRQVRNVRITSVGCYVPPRTLTNADLEKIVETTDEWIVSRPGIRTPHIADEDVATSDLAVEAAKVALAQRSLSGSDIETVIVCTVTPDMLFPSTACLVQDRIGAKGADAGNVTVLESFYPLADVIELLKNEDVVPAGANRPLYLLAPLITAVPALIAFAVIPYGGVYQFGDTVVSLVVADIDWGVLYIFVIGSLATYAAAIAGWASNDDSCAGPPKPTLKAH